MRTHLSFEFSHRDEFPDEGEDFRTPHVLVERFLEEYTDPGDRVIDIFAGFGTTLSVAEDLDRVPYGIEYESERADWIREQISHSEHVRNGDVLDLESSWFPPVDCCFTSPPFMERGDDRNPFRNYAGESTYDAYLNDIETAFERLDSVLSPGGSVIIDVSNMKYQDRVTTLAWDVADRVSSVLHFDGEVVVTWTHEDPDEADGPAFGYGYDHSYCLVFTKPGA